MWRNSVAVLWCVALAAQQQFMPLQGRSAVSQLPVSSTDLRYGDFTGDGRADAVLISNGGMWIYRSLGNGGYAGARQLSSIRYTNPLVRLHTGDYDADGDLDFVVVGLQGVDLYANDGTGTFSADGSLGVQGSWQGSALEFADLDGDGDLDFVLANDIAIRTAIRLADGSYRVRVLGSTFVGVGNNLSMAVVDVDGDGDCDVVTAMVLPGTLYPWFENDGAGNFVRGSVGVPFAGTPTAIAASDIDGDGRVDLVAAMGVVNLQMLLGNGDGTFDNAPTPLPTARGAPLVGDFDLDGDLDLIVVSSQMSFLRNDGGGAFIDLTTSRWGGLGLPSNMSFAVTDIDGDGDLDVRLGSRVVRNHVRQLASISAARVGGLLELDVYSGPGFAPPAWLPVLMGTRLPARPIRIPGFAGALDLAPNELVVVAAPFNSTVGRNRVFLSVPSGPQFIGLDIWCQSVVLPLSGNAMEPGFSNTVYERILP